MKRLLGLAALCLLTTSAHAVDYLNSKITGIGMVAGETRIRFTIDQDPNVIFTTNQFTDEQLKRLVALLFTAYTTEAPIVLIRSAENTSSTQRHYSDVLIVSMGSYTFD